MKKVIALLGVMLFSASAFALNAAAPAGKDCAAQKAEFEKYVAGQNNISFIAQNILINLADPMENQTDEEALDQAACYDTFEVRGQSLASFVHRNANIFPGDIYGREAAKMNQFADRIQRLGAQAKLNKVAAQGNTSHTVEFILINFADPMAKLSDSQAAPLAKAYKGCNVNGQPMTEFVRVHASEFMGNVSQELDAFVERVNKLTK